MTSWVYLLSQFTPEALLFEALLIFLLGCGYATFWILKKRRFGMGDSDLPSGPVKVYLNELIGNAEQLRAQLFGLLSSSEGAITQVQRKVEISPPTPDPMLVELQEKIKQQTQVIDALNLEK